MAEYSYCVDTKNCITQELCDTDRFIGNNCTTISVNTKNNNVSPEIGSEEISDLVTPVLCNRVDNTTDLDHDRSNNEISDTLQNDLKHLDINKNNPEIRIDIANSPELNIDISEDTEGSGTLDSADDVNKTVTFGLHCNEESYITADSERTDLEENSLKMEDTVFKDDALMKAKSDTHLDKYVSTFAKVRKLSPSDLTSSSSTACLGTDSNSKVVLRCRRKHSSGSDVGRRSRPVSEEIFEDEITDEELPPCDCDECLFNPVEERPKPPPEERKLSKKQSSWKKIRNIVHWTPFIQQFKRRRYPWIQLAGHQGNFHAGEQPGAILKKYDAQECKSFHKLMKDVLRPYVPEFRGEASKDGQHYIQLQDLLCEFEAPCVMDVKMGCRTYLEEELTKAREKPTLRKDMYQKMVEVDPTAPTAEENSQKAITKPRYMQWRDDMSSSVELGFRIEGVRTSDGASIKNFKKTKQRSCIKETLRQFVRDNESVANTYLRRLKSIRATQEASSFFKSHEIIGSSLLFVHDKTGQASIWMIDFGKTVPLSENVTVNHKSKWEEGNHEDGYLLGISSLIELFEDLVQEKLHSSKDTSSDNVTDRTTERTTESVESSLTESEQKDSEGVSSTDKNSNQNDQSENTAKEPVPTDSLKESHC